MNKRYFSRYQKSPQREEIIPGLGMRRVYGPIAERQYEAAQFHTIVQGDRLDLLAYRYYGDASKWWIIADANHHLFKASELALQLICDDNIGARLVIPHNPIKASV